MWEVVLTIESHPDPTEIERLNRGLTSHRLPVTGPGGFQPLAVLARDPEHGLVGGASGRCNWSWLHVSKLWVTDDRRGQGLGARILRALETEAARRGCRQAHLDTFDFQARAFYEKLGYREFASLEDYPPGHERIFLRRALPAPG